MHTGAGSGQRPHPHRCGVALVCRAVLAGGLRQDRDHARSAAGQEPSEPFILFGDRLAGAACSATPMQCSKWGH